MQISCPSQPCLKSAVTKHTVPGILQRPLQSPYDSPGNLKKGVLFKGIIVFLHMVYFVVIFLTLIHVHIFVYYPLAYIFRGP